MDGFVIAGTHSGVGKTSVTLGLLGLLRERGLRPQPFKVGPDFIDPSLHTFVSGRASRNLDGWLMSPRAVLEIYNNACRGAGIAVVEGVMGLFDGCDGLSDRGSTAHIARLLRLPVILVVDASAISRSAAAIVLGYKEMDPQLNLAGVILNRTGGKLHRQWLTDAIRNRTGTPVLGCIPFDAELNIPERHLGLIPAAESHLSNRYLTQLKKQIAQNIDLPRILKLAKGGSTIVKTKLFRVRSKRRGISIAIPRDKSLNFYYQDNLDIFENLGAELLYFRPADGEAVPANANGIYMGGGFPEIYAAELASNRKFLTDLRQSAKKRMPIYAECGGLMCLTDAIVDFEGNERKMASVISAKAVMQNKLAAIGYVRVRNDARNLFGPRGTSFRGHVFHNSVLKTKRKLKQTYLVNLSGRRFKEGFSGESFLASYVHVHFASKPQLASRFVKACHEAASEK